MDPQPKAVIIGAGIGGLASAIRLALQGMEVTVFEKNAYPGGKLSHFELEGYLFDAGPSLFTQPQHIEALFQLAGEPIEDYFSYTGVPVSCEYFYEDGTRIHAYADREAFSKELTEKLGESENALADYLNRSENIYQKIGKIFLSYSLHKWKTFVKIPVWDAVKALRWPYLFHTLHEVNARHFTNEKTIQLFNRYATYNGSNPYRAPGMLSLIPHLEHNEGTFYPRGGMISITRALYQLALKKGVRFHFNTPVQRIIESERKIRGVVVHDTNIYADLVVSNMDVYFTYAQLLNDPGRARKLLKQERSSSAFIFYWGMNRSFPELNLHNIFFARDYKSEFNHLFTQKKIYPDPSVYINITGKCEPGIQAPVGKENWFVMVNAPANIGQDWTDYRNRYKEAVIAKLSRILGADIASCIEVESYLDPVLIESRTASFMGSLYGTSSNARMAAFLRHPNFSKQVRGLYFTGGSVHPGGGIPLCLQSAAIMSELVAADQKKNRKQSHR